MNKKHIVDLLIARLQTELDGVTQAAKSSHEAATAHEAKAESQYDTFGLEASYLAGAQSQRVADLQATLSAYRLLELREFAPNEPIALGALVELEMTVPKGGRRSTYLLVAHGGGLSVSIDSTRSVQALALVSPMGEALLDRKVGETIEIEAKDTVREYRVLHVE